MSSLRLKAGEYFGKLSELLFHGKELSEVVFCFGAQLSVTSCPPGWRLLGLRSGANGEIPTIMTESLLMISGRSITARLGGSDPICVPSATSGMTKPLSLVLDRPGFRLPSSEPTKEDFLGCISAKTDGDGLTLCRCCPT